MQSLERYYISYKLLIYVLSKELILQMPRTKSNLSRRSRAARHGKRRRLNETEEERRKRINVIRTYFLLARARESSTERAKRLAIQRMRQAKYRKAKKYATERALKIHHLIVPSTSSQVPNNQIVCE